MDRFAYEFQEDTRLFKFYDSNQLAYFCILPSDADPEDTAENLIQEVKHFECSR